MRLIFFIVLALHLLLVGGARADGLIYRLPDDGAWVTYTFEQHAEIEYQFKKGAEPPPGEKELVPRTAVVTGFLTIRSVGRVGEGDKAQRWIEIEQSVQAIGRTTDDREADPHRRTIILKLLVPETRLKAGEDPFAHVSKLIFKDGDRKVEEITDAKRRRYELDRFRPLFPTPAAKPTRTAEQLPPTTRPPGAKLRCELLAFPSEYEGLLSGGTSGLWTYKGEHRVWLSDQVPFGVAALEFVSESKERYGADAEVTNTTKGTRRLVLAESGTKAKSRLPDSK